jgi:putative tricarboxylic transport membrane protein
MGFMAFGASAILAILSIGVFLSACFAKDPDTEEAPFSGILWKRVSLVVIILFLYASLMPTVGYLISTLLLMVLLFMSIGKREIWQIAVISVLTAAATYYVFSIVLKCQFPSGILGF